MKLTLPKITNGFKYIVKDNLILRKSKDFDNKLLEKSKIRTDHTGVVFEKKKNKKSALSRNYFQNHLQRTRKRNQFKKVNKSEIYISTAYKK